MDSCTLENAKRAFEARWASKQIWHSLYLDMGPFSIDVHETKMGPHVLIYDDDKKRLNTYLSNLIYATAGQYSPEDLVFFVIDPDGDALCRSAQEFPHFIGGISRMDEWNLGIHLLKEELLHREQLLKESDVSSASQYAEAYHERKLDKPMPALFLIINGSACTGKPEYIEDVCRLLRFGRSLSIYCFMTWSHSEWSDLIDTAFRVKLNLKSHAYHLPEQTNAMEHLANLFKQYAKPLNLHAKPLTENQVWQWSIISDSGKHKTLKLIHGDLCTLHQRSDIVVCSSYEGDYRNTSTSLIGALVRQKGINVFNLAKCPEIDFRRMGCWLSQETGTDYRRIACVELLKLREYALNPEQSMDKLVRKSFSTLRYILEQADIAGLPVNTVALPILGSGEQQIDLAYILGPLISNCRAILKSNTGVENIVIYEKEWIKAQIAANAIHEALLPKETPPKIFISYSSKQEPIAKEICSALEGHGILCWMAPDSIPEGSSYQSAIPVALSQVEIVLLILTPDAEQSRWVQKEIGSAIGANKVILPYQLQRYDLSLQFKFLLDGEQIMYHPSESKVLILAEAAQGAYSPLVTRIKTILNAACNA